MKGALCAKAGEQDSKRQSNEEEADEEAIKLDTRKETVSRKRSWQHQKRLHPGEKWVLESEL